MQSNVLGCLTILPKLYFKTIIATTVLTDMFLSSASYLGYFEEVIMCFLTVLLRYEQYIKTVAI